MRSWYAKIRADFVALANLQRALPAGGGFGTRTFRRCAFVVRLAGTEHTGPAKLGLAVLLGVTIGLTPLFGLHLIICLLLASALRLNKVLVYAAANVSVPPLVPFIAVACIQAGHYAAHGRWLALDTYSPQQLRHVFLYYWLGGAVINGAVLGGVAGAGVWLAARRRQAAARRRQAAAAAAPAPPVAALARLYAAFLPEGKLTAEIMRGKVRHDVAYGEVLRAATSPASLLDVGGGYGTLALLLTLARPPQTAARVLDWDAAKVALGARVAARLAAPVAFEHADVFRQADFGAPATLITCIDVLHYAPLAQQRALVAKLADALAPGGLLIIRDMDGDRKARTALTVLQEKLSLLTRRTLATAVVPRSGRDLETQLRACGLAVTARRCHGRTPFSNTLWVARKPALSGG